MTATATGDQATPDAIMQLGFAFWGSKALLSAVELGLFTELARGGPRDAAGLAACLGLHARGARDFLDALVALGMLEREAGRYANTPATALYLDRGSPGYLGGMLEMANARLYPFWGSLTEALRTGAPQNEVKHGRDLFGALYGDPERLRGFAAAMTALSLAPARAMAAAFPWERHRSFVDIGCAEGGLPAQIARVHPHLAGGGFDLPALRPLFEAHAAAQGLAGRLAFHAGDFFADPLPRADVLVMGHVLHDWDLERKLLLIGKAHAALPPGGALIVYETLIDDNRRANAFGLLMSLNMLIETPGGFDFTAADCIGWMRQAGFREAAAHPLTGADSMVIGLK
ncbi:methyltransferase [Dankookia rubra]|uniref:Methyltransferase n=1 Tax=Dankookia rubra TaxID=1442381 RepID=A0A4R5Q875_9PROT|nr:methyltransferase [Dankookia rubra]TDH58946.1 methyltransferase [Dankookia rubra]